MLPNSRRPELDPSRQGHSHRPSPACARLVARVVMFGGYGISYARDVDAQVHDPPGEPHDQANDQANDGANERKGLRALFRNAAAGDGGRAGTTSAGVSAASSVPRSSSRAVTPRATTQSKASQSPASPSAASPSAASPSAAPRQHVAGPLISRPLISRPLMSPRMRADPRLRVWITRFVVSLAFYIGFTIGLNWRYGLTAAVVYAAADSLFRSRTAVVVPASVRITSAQRFTRRRLKILRPSGYHALHARSIPGTSHVIDHVVVGPAGVFTLDSERLDRRLPLRMIDGMLYHGRVSMDGRLDHATEEASYAARFIGAELGRPVAVNPVMVTYGPDTSWVIMAVKGIDVLDGSRVGTYFRRRSREIRRQAKNDGPQALSSHQVDAIAAAAARALPPLA